ncbi:MAG: penicillin-binding transpeptidase domain-containing protein [Bryobacteraceae bacterium]|nr:penicillin-binding transpeptidase domain-containing protein [Bryobacteraceae bacterium]
MTRRDWLLSALPLAPPSGGRTMAFSRGAFSGDRDSAGPGDAVVLNGASRKVLLEQGDFRRSGLPGSTLKPFVLAALLDRHLLKPNERLECPGEFRLGEHNLECDHARNAGPLDAVEALAVSCNFWFAIMSKRLGPEGLLKALRRVGLAAQRAPNEEQACVQALGLAHVSASPLTLAHAYAELLKAGPPAAVLQGMRAAVERGTAQRALSDRVWIAGKTGTAPGGLPGSSAGWFAGWAMRPDAVSCPAAQAAGCLHSRPSIAFAVRVVGGTGGGAAADLGKEVTEQWAQGAWSHVALKAATEGPFRI